MDISREQLKDLIKECIIEMNDTSTVNEGVVGSLKYIEANKIETPSVLPKKFNMKSYATTDNKSSGNSKDSKEEKNATICNDDIKPTTLQTFEITPVKLDNTVLKYLRSNGGISPYHKFFIQCVNATTKFIKNNIEPFETAYIADACGIDYKSVDLKSSKIRVKNYELKLSIYNGYYMFNYRFYFETAIRGYEEFSYGVSFLSDGSGRYSLIKY